MCSEYLKGSTMKPWCPSNRQRLHSLYCLYLTEWDLKEFFELNVDSSGVAFNLQVYSNRILIGTGPIKDRLQKIEVLASFFLLYYVILVQCVPIKNVTKFANKLNDPKIINNEHAFYRIQYVKTLAKQTKEKHRWNSQTYATTIYYGTINQLCVLFKIHSTDLLI